MHRWKKAAALALAALTLAGTLSACAPGTGSSSEVGGAGESSQPQLKNNGEDTHLTVAEIFVTARQKLEAYRPVSIGQASRISGVSPADVSVLLVYLEQYRKGRQ